MKKVFDVLDPRKSRDLRREDNKVYVTGKDPDGKTTIEETYEATQLFQALKSLSERKLAGSFTVVLPVTAIHVKSALVIPENVSIVGQVLNSRVESEAELRSSRLIIDANGCIQPGGSGCSLSNVTIELSKKCKATVSNAGTTGAIFVSEGKILNINECVVQAEEGSAGDKLGLITFGELNVKGCWLNGVRIAFERLSSGSITATNFTNSFVSGSGSGRKSKSRDENNENETSAVIIDTELAILFDKCEIRDFQVGLLLDNVQRVKIQDSTIAVMKVGVDLRNGEMEINDSVISSAGKDGKAVKVKGSFAHLKIKGTQICKSSVGLLAESESVVSLENSQVFNSSLCGVRVEGGARVECVSVRIYNTKDDTTKADGVQIISRGTLSVKKSSIGNFKGSGVICQDEQSQFDFSELDVSENVVGGLFGSNGAVVTGENAFFSNNQGQVMSFRDERTTVVITGAKIKGGNVGVIAAKGSSCKFKDLRLEELLDKAVFIYDASVTITQAQVNQTQTSKLGIVVKFKGNKRERVILQDCKAQGCSEGIRIEQVGGNQSTLDNKDGYEGSSTGLSHSALSDVESKCEIENGAFVQCEIGFYVDGARVDLKGCSFIMNKKHSLYIKNQMLRPGQHIRKEANLKVRWPNYVEPYIDNGDNVSNDHQLLTSVTKEKSFCGSADFEPIMYLSTLTERIRQARTLFRSKEPDSLQTARVIMRSVSHMLILLKQLPARLLERDLNDDPDLGMFAATFKLYDEKTGPTNTLVSMKDLFTSWRTLHRTRLFDSALQALNEAFQEKQVNEDLYDEWVTPLEEMQRVCFVKSKYNRRRDYLLTTAKETPLTTWYFLDKESPNTDEGKRLRDEVLRFLAADREENRLHNKTNFHASWVAQWAVQMLGEKFLESPIPDDLPLRKAWADNLLDARMPKQILEAYERSSLANLGEVDELVKFECYKMYEAMGNKLNSAQLAKLATVLGGNGFAAAIQTASKLFPGEGALPGFLRRVAEEASSLEMLLEPLSNIQDIANSFTRKQRDRVVLAVMSHYTLPDSKVQPDIYRRNGTSYETCEMCLVQKLQPWNELKLESCQHNHRFCRPCMKASMSQAQQGLWGVCPGRTDDGKACNAQATRREMELAGMDRDLIYNIISKRVTTLLTTIPGWKPCDAPGCIGGKSNVTKTFYSCRLCNKMVTMDGGLSDPTVPKRLLQGLDGSAVMRGEGVFRECYWCAVTYEKGNACSTITCANCSKQFSMTWGPDKITHRFDEEGISPQRYVPKVAGKLWELGVFKDRKGVPLKLGQTLTEQEAIEVVRRAKLRLVEYTD